MQRSISSFALLFASVSAIIGSGWLFSSYYASTLAGPAAILSWALGAIAMLIVAFVFGEVSAMLPITGSSIRIPQFTHGTAVSFTFSWIIWLSYASLAPCEVQAVIQYASFYFPNLTAPDGSLTGHGYILAVILMILISTINIYSLRWLMRSNNFLTVLKIIIPTFIAAVIIILFFSVGKTINPHGSSFMPFGMRGVFVAISSGGIVFAFNGFKQAAEMAGEAKNPKVALPLALIGSITICFIIFALLQIAFINALHAKHLAGGWKSLTLTASASPLAAIILENKLEWLFPALFACAILAPMAAALMYCSSSSRSLYGMSKNGYIPAIFQKLSPQGNPVNAIIVNFLLGMLMFAPLPGWSNMASFLSSLMAVTYCVGPITLLALRKQLPNQRRVFRLPFAYLWSTVAFYICTMLVYWCGWNIISKLSSAIFVCAMILVAYQINARRKQESLPLDWQASTWMWVYFAGISLISYLGNFGGGLSLLPENWDYALLALFSVSIIWLAMRFKLQPEKTREYVSHLNLVGNEVE